MKNAINSISFYCKNVISPIYIIFFWMECLSMYICVYFWLEVFFSPKMLICEFFSGRFHNMHTQRMLLWILFFNIHFFYSLWLILSVRCVWILHYKKKNSQHAYTSDNLWLTTISSQSQRTHTNKQAIFSIEFQYWGYVHCSKCSNMYVDMFFSSLNSICECFDLLTFQHKILW